MTFLHITDLHLGEAGETVHNVETRRNFEALIEAISREKADYLVLTGDFVLQEDNEAVYSWLCSRLPLFPGGVLVTAGNHDNTALLRKVFPEQFDTLPLESPLYSTHTIDGMQVLCLDSSPGYVSRKQLAVIERKLSEVAAASDMQIPKVILFIHHPPVIGKVRVMDANYALTNMDEVQDVLSRFLGSVYVFCGHYHVERAISMGNMTIWITPSNVFQVDHDAERIMVDHYAIGYRLITIENQVVHTWVRYLEAPGAPQ
jgi:Icc protein